MSKRALTNLGAVCVAATLLMAAAARADDLRKPYPETRQVLAELAVSGRAALAHYHRSERQARNENQPFIADLFKAMAVSQAVMNRNFVERLNDLGGRATACAVPDPEQQTTRRNLVTAIRNEIRETDKIYPEALARVTREGHSAVVALLEQAIRAQQLRRRDMQEIMVGARYFYTRLQSEVRRRATVYYICGQSGALLLNDLPAICPVRGAATYSYRALHQFQAAAEWQACHRSPAAQHL